MVNANFPAVFLMDLQKVCDLPNGHELFVEPNGVGGRRYISSEITGIVVWDTSLADSTTLLHALLAEGFLVRTDEGFKESQS